MGTDKAFIPINGRILVERAASALLASGAEPVVIVGGSDPRLADLGLIHIGDPFPGGGPAQAIAGALEHLEPAEVVVVLACDLLAPDPAAIHTVVAALVDRPGAAVAVPVIEGEPQWLHGAWRPATALAQLRAAWRRGIRSIHASLDPGSVIKVAGIDPAAVADADTPSDLPD